MCPSKPARRCFPSTDLAKNVRTQDSCTLVKGRSRGGGTPPFDGTRPGCHWDRKWDAASVAVGETNHLPHVDSHLLTYLEGIEDAGSFVCKLGKQDQEGQGFYLKALSSSLAARPCSSLAPDHLWNVRKREETVPASASTGLVGPGKEEKGGTLC